jgi:hypothetical protein
MGHLTRDFFVAVVESYGFVFYWGALSDERSGLSCVGACLQQVKV